MCEYLKQRATSLITNPLGREQISYQGKRDFRGRRCASQVSDSTLTITQTTRQAIAERALLRPKFSPLKGVTRGVNHRLETSADDRMSQQKGTRISFKTGLSRVIVQHATYAIRPKTSADRKSGRRKEDYRLIQDQL